MLEIVLIRTELLSPALGFIVAEDVEVFGHKSESSSWLKRQAQFYQNLCMMALRKISSILRGTRGEGNMPQNDDPKLDLHEIQGDVLIGLQKNFENFIFFKIVDIAAFKAAMRQHVIGQITTTLQAHERDLTNHRRKRLGEKIEPWLGLNVSFSKDGLTTLLGSGRAKLSASFENGAEAASLALNDPSPSTWVSQFRSDRIDGVFFVTGP